MSSWCNHCRAILEKLKYLLVHSFSQMESHTLAMSYHITEQLQMAYVNLMGSIQGLPCTFQQNIELALHSIRELQATFTDAQSFQDLSSSLLIQSKKTAGMAQKYVDDILDYVLQNTPLSWLVGPFVPALGWPGACLMKEKWKLWNQKPQRKLSDSVFSPDGSMLFLRYKGSVQKRL